MTAHGPDHALHTRPSRPAEGRAWLAHQQSDEGLAPRITQVALPDHAEPGAVAVALAGRLAGRAELTRLYRFDEACGLLVTPGRGRPDLRLRWAASADGIGPVIDSCAGAPWDLSHEPPLRVVLVLAPGATRLALIRHPVADDLPDSAALLAELVPGAQPASETGTGDAIARLILAEFRSALEAPQMTADCDFFDMGGHSLTATRVIGRLAATHGIELRLNDLFLHPTAAALASFARRTGPGTETAPDRCADPAGRAPLSLAQASLWKIYAALGFGPIFNIPFVLRFLDPVDEAVFATAFRDVMERHPALRSRFADGPGGVFQEAVPMETVDRMGWFRPSGDVEDPAPVLTSEAAHDFDLARELPVRLRFIRTGEGQLLSFLFHHIVLDEWSVNLMMDELARAYAARAAGRPPLWAAPAAPFHAFARNQAARGPDPRALDHWLNALRDAPPPCPIRRPDAPPLPAPQGPDAANDAGGAWCEIALEPHVSDGLYALSRACSASLFNTVYAAISVALQRLAGLDALTVGTSASGRTDPGYFDTIGYFTTVTAHCLGAPGRLTPRALIGRVRDMINGSLPHCEIPIDLVEERLSDGTSAPGAHMFEVFIQIHARNALNGVLEGPDGPVRFRQVDPDKTDSVLGLQFEVVEDVIGGERGLRMMMSYRHAHYSADDVAGLVAAVTRTCTAFAGEGAADRPLDALLS
ncbi:condensation domain-containing protein [Rhodovulum sp. YEN HP10]|uniref:condensation domain-containing protein n=1 Tax=Rhodovulum sp. HP10 TaxID=3387397 RepID=UPI0039E104B3